MDQAEILTIIEDATHQRGWISNSYAQVEYLLGDLIMRCRQFPEYAAQTEIFTHSASKRVAKVRSMLKTDGPLSPYSSEISDVLDAFEGNHEVRNLLAHGFCEFHFTPTGDAGLVFKKFDRVHTDKGEDPDVIVQQTFRLVDMYYYKEQFVFQAQHALEIFAKIHLDLGWGDIDPESLVDGWIRPLS